MRGAMLPKEADFGNCARNGNESANPRMIEAIRTPAGIAKQ